MITLRLRQALLPVGIALVAGIVNWVCNSRFSFNLWDNFETFTPLTLAGHSLWLQGHVPVLSLSEGLGLPLMGNGQSGMLYFPTTVGLLILRGLGVADQNLPEVMGIFHLTVAMSGWFALLRALSVRREFALIMATGLTGSGSFLMGSALFQHIGSEYGWLPWVLWALIHLIDDQAASIRWALIYAGLWWLCASGSHIQMLAYIMIHIFCFALIYAWSKGVLRAKAMRLSVSLLWLPFLALPAFSYSLVMHAAVQRVAELPREIFFEGGMRWADLLGLFTPFVAAQPIVMALPNSFLGFAGAWMLAFVLVLRRNPLHSRLGWGLLVLSLLFLDFGLGENGLIYPHTYGLPVWSSFRWPFKFVFHWIGSLGILAALMLETEWAPLSKRVRLITAGLLILLPLVLARPETPAGWILFGAQAALLLSLAGVRAIAPYACFVYLTAAVWMAGEQPAHRYAENYGEYGASYFGLAEPELNRLVPLSFNSCENDACNMQPLALFDSAIINGYSTLTGHVMATSGHALNQLVSSNAWGVVVPATAELAIGRSLYRSLGVRYYLVAENEAQLYQPLFDQRGLRFHKAGPGWRVYEDSQSQGLLSVPNQVVPLLGRPLNREVFGSENPWLTAFVDGLDRPIQSQNTRAFGAQILPGRGLRFEAENNSRSESLVQAAVYPWPFMKAETESAGRLETYSSNGVATAIIVPPGRHTIELKASLLPLWAGLLTALVALVFGLALISWRARRA